MLRIGNTVGAAMSDRRVLEPVEMRIMTTVGLLLLGLAVLFTLFPRLLAYPLIAIILWLAAALLYRGYELHRERERERERGRGVPHPAQITPHRAAGGAQEVEPKKD
jgi:cardiolipin synthase A/B